MFDIIIKNAFIIDGTDSRRFKADIGIEGSEIVKIGNLKHQLAKPYGNISKSKPKAISHSVHLILAERRFEHAVLP